MSGSYLIFYLTPYLTTHQQVLAPCWSQRAGTGDAPAKHLTTLLTIADASPTRQRWSVRGGNKDHGTARAGCEIALGLLVQKKIERKQLPSTPR